MKSLSQFMSDIQSTLDKTHTVRKNTLKEKPKSLLYFAYGHNTYSKQFAKYCTGAKFVGVGMLKNFSMYFEEYANIRMDQGDDVKGVVWEIKAEQIKNLDGYEALHKDYNRIPVEVTVDGNEELCIAYIMDPTFEVSKLHVKPTKEYIQTVAAGYKEHGIPLEQIKTALTNS